MIKIFEVATDMKERLVQYTDMRSQLYKQVSLLSTAAEKGWIGEQFKFFVKNNTGGSAALESGGRISTATHPMFLPTLFCKHKKAKIACTVSKRLHSTNPNRRLSILQFLPNRQVSRRPPPRCRLGLPLLCLRRVPLKRGRGFTM